MELIRQGGEAESISGGVGLLKGPRRGRLRVVGGTEREVGRRERVGESKTGEAGWSRQGRVGPVRRTSLFF